MYRQRPSDPSAAGRLVLVLLLMSLAAAEGRAETFSFRGNRMETVLIEGRERVILSGAARVDSDGLTIRAEQIELYGEDYVFVQCRGQVRVEDPGRGIELSSEELFYDRRQKISRIRGNAVMVDRENEVVIRGGFIEDHELQGETLIQIGVRILKTDLVCRAEFARYHRDEETLELSGLPFIRWKGDEYEATQIFMDLENERIRLEGDIRGRVEEEQDAGNGS